MSSGTSGVLNVPIHQLRKLWACSGNEIGGKLERNGIVLKVGIHLAPSSKMTFRSWGGTKKLWKGKRVSQRSFRKIINVVESRHPMSTSKEDNRDTPAKHKDLKELDGTVSSSKFPNREIMKIRESCSDCHLYHPGRFH